MRHCRSPHAREMYYGGPLGFEELRKAICTYLRTARAVRCDPQQVMIVAGSQQALEIAARVLLDDRSAAWVEEPGYWLTRQVLTAAGCRLVPVPVDSEGLDVAFGVKKCRKAKAAFVAPSHQYPLGATMSASRRLQLLDWAQSSGSWVIRACDSEYRYGNMPIASLQGLDHNSRVIYIGTFSKTLFPSLRLGYTDAIRSALYGDKGGLPPGAKVAIITFDRSIHFYNLKVFSSLGKCNIKASLDQPQMMVVPDVEDAFVPIQEDFFVDPHNSRLVYYSSTADKKSTNRTPTISNRVNVC